MAVYEIGPDSSEFADYDKSSEYEFVIVDYAQGSYDGRGIAVGFKADGTVDVYNLDHCSCYGPYEHGPEKVLTREEFLNVRENDIDMPDRKRLEDDIDCDTWEAIFIQYDKVIGSDNG